MKRVRRTSFYIKWFKKLKDKTGKLAIAKRVNRLCDNDMGDVSPIGDGLSEMRIHDGPGYRVYFKDTGKEIVLLLCGGDKSTQQADIVRAKKLVLIPLEEEKVWKK
jgi:putative addiction module killer protein